MPRRRILYLLLVLAALPVLMLAGLQWWLGSRFTAAGIEAMLEKDRSCDVTVDRVDLSVFSIPSRMEITGLRAVPAGAPDAAGDTAVTIKSLRLEVSVWSLIRGVLTVNRADIDGVEIKGVRTSRGNSLSRMTGRPTAASATTALLLEDADEWPDGASPADKPLNIADLPISASLREARLSRLTFSLRDDSRNTVTRLDDVDIALSGMTLDPGNPAAGGSARIRASARYSLERTALQMRTLDFLLGLQGDYTLFDPRTGDLNTAFDFQFTVRRGSILNRLPTLVRLNERLAKLKKSTGLDLAFPEEATLLADAPLTASLRDGVITLREDFLLPFDACDLGLTRASRLSVRTGDHTFTGHLAANPAFSAKAVTGIQNYLAERSPELAKLVERTVLANLLTADQRLHIPYESEGSISQPSVKAGDKLEDALRDSLKDAGKDLLKDAIEGGGDVEDIFKSLRREIRGK